jgi:excisionase family DNA binding protein
MAERVEISVATAAKLLNTSRCTIYRLIEKRELQARRRGPGGWYRIDRESVNELLKKFRLQMGIE